MPRLLRVFRVRRSWQGRVGCYWRPPEEDCVRRERFALCSAASAPSLPWCRVKRTLGGFRPRVSASKKTCACWCSSDAPYEHQRPSPIAHFGGRLRVTTCKPRNMPTCEPRNVPGVFPAVIGTERPRGWDVCSCTRAGTLLQVPPSRGTRDYASLSWPGIVLSHKILWLWFFSQPLPTDVKISVSCLLKHTPSGRRIRQMPPASPGGAQGSGWVGSQASRKCAQ